MSVSLTLTKITATSVSADVSVYYSSDIYGYEMNSYLYDSNGVQIDQYEGAELSFGSPVTSFDDIAGFDGLSPNTTYTIKVEYTIYPDSSHSLGIIQEAEQSFTTTAVDDNYEPDFSKVEIVQDFSQTTYDSVAFYITGLDPVFPDEYELLIAVEDDSGEWVGTPSYYTFTTRATATTSLVFTGLNYNSTYTAYLMVGYAVNGVDDAYELRNSVYTYDHPDNYEPDLYRLNVNIVAATSNSVTMQIVGLDPYYTSDYGWDVLHRVRLNDENGSTVSGTYDTFNIPAGQEASPYFTLSGLSKGQRYYIDLRLNYMDCGSSNTARIGFNSFYLDDYIGSTDETEPTGENLCIVQVESDSVTTLALSVYNLDEDYYGEWTFEWQLGVAGGVYTQSQITYASGSDYSSGVAEFAGLSPGLLYNARVTVKYTYGGSTYTWGTLTGTFSTNGTHIDMNSAEIIAQSSEDGKTVTVYVENLGTGYDNGRATINWYHTSTTYASVGSTTVYDTDTSESFDYVNMIPGKTYTLYAEIIYYNNGQECSAVIHTSITTNESVTIDGAYIDLYAKTGTTITVIVRGLDSSYSRNDRKITWSINGVTKPAVSLSAATTTSATYKFESLNPSTEYTIGASIYYTSNGVGNTKVLKDVYLSTANWASVQETNIGTVSVSEEVTWVLQKATLSYAAVKFSASGTVVISCDSSYDTYGYLTTGSPSFDNSTGIPDNYETSDDDSGDGNNFQLTWTVTAGTTYYIWARGYSTGTSVGTVTITIFKDDKPAKFAWTYKKTQYGGFNLTAAEWKGLQTKVNEVRAYLSSKYSDSSITQWPSGTLTQGTGYFTSPSSGQNFTAIHYNQVLMAISGAYQARGVSGYYNKYKVTQYDDVTAYCLNILVTLVNDLIDA